MTTKQSTGIVLLLCGLALSCQQVPSPSVTPPAPSMGGVTGSVAAIVGAKAIALPDVTVQLRRFADGQQLATAVTNLDGRYLIDEQPLGRYQLCWDAPGFVAGCSNSPVDIQGPHSPAPDLEILPEGHALFGRVVQRDGRVCNYRNAVFGVDAQAEVTVSSAAGEAVAPPVHPNVDGYYVVPRPPLGRFSVRATCELSNTTLTAETAGIEHTEFNLTLPNTSPVISAVATTADGRGVYRVRSGTTVQVTANARDADGDRLHYRWFPSTGSFVARDSGTIDWKLPDGPGLHTMSILVSDGKGGYAYDSASVSTRADTPLGGHVVDETGAPVADARVSVNDASARTDGEGRFHLSLQGDEDRHVLTISKDRHQLVSRILQGPLIGGESSFRLNAARNFVVDPAAGVSIVDRPKRVSQRGAEISIAPRSLAPMADRSRATSEPLIVSVTTIDPADPDNGLPGDGSGINARGEPVSVESLGAVEVEFRDEAGNLYNLIDGRTATVRIPIEPEGKWRGRLPSSAPVWFYDLASGTWREDGVARLAGNFYEAQVRHFSTINVGYPSPDGVTCARLRTSLLSQDLNYLPQFPFNVNITVKLNGSVVKTVTGAIDNPLSALLNLPTSNLPNRKYTVDVVPDGCCSNFQTTFITDSTNVPGTPSYPYEECRSQTLGAISATNGRTDVNFAVQLPTITNGDHFLTFGHGFGSQDYADLYYAQIDPDSSKTTFAAWKTLNGFDKPPELDNSAAAFYFNAGDLGFGRWMNMRRDVSINPPAVAYYVSNYKDVDDAIANSGLIATVAMEYSPIAGVTTDNVTKFYVFNNQGNRVGFANLDGTQPNGNKFVPHLCVICHGGNTPVTPTYNLAARFIGFDLKSFRYSTTNNAYSRSAQEAQFKTLNARVLDTVPGGCIRSQQYGYTGGFRTICALIEGWYGGQGLPNPTQDDNFIPDVTSPTEGISWYNNNSNATAGLYLNVVTQCRSCHSTRGTNLDWGTYSLFLSRAQLIRNRVCGDPGSGIGRQMPNSQRTWYNFWTSTGSPTPPFDPHGPRVLRSFLQGTDAGLDCVPLQP